MATALKTYAQESLCDLRHVTAFLYLGVLGSSSALCLGAVTNGEITNRKAQKFENHGTTQTMKRILVYSVRA